MVKTDVDTRFSLEQGKYFLGKGDYQKALQIFNNIDSDSNSTLEYIVDCYTGLGNHDAGIGLLNIGIKKQPQNTSFWNKLADIYFLREEYELSVAALDQCFKKETTKELVEKKLNCLFKLNSFDEMVNFYDELSDRINENFLSFSSVYLLGNAFFNNGKKSYETFNEEDTIKNFDKAEHFFKKLFSTNYDDKNFLYDYVQLLTIKGDYDSALKFCNNSFLLTGYSIFKDYNFNIKKLMGAYDGI
jgi:tetratricopeptide (TPR) repeat protein